MDYQRWESKLMSYHFRIAYKPDINNKAADALSHINWEEQIALSAMISVGGVEWQEILNMIQGDKFLQQLKDDLAAGKPCPTSYELVHAIVRYKGRLVVPQNLRPMEILLKEYHDTPIRGHSGECKTYQRLVKEWHWVGMR